MMGTFLGVPFSSMAKKLEVLNEQTSLTLYRCYKEARTEKAHSFLHVIAQSELFYITLGH